MKNRKNIFGLFYFLTFLCLCFGLVVNNYRTVFISTLTFVLFLAIVVVEKVCKVDFPFLLRLFMFVFIFFAEILGEVFYFYSAFSFWDNFLHSLAGMISACFGFSFVFAFFKRCMVGKNLFLISFIFTFCFSVTTGVFWEFIEFGFDRCFGFDMQKDNYISGFNTMSLDDSGVVISKVSDIKRTVVYTDEGVVVMDDGYLDIGLIDTMEDLFMNVISALVVALCGSCYIARKKGFSFMEFFRVRRC